MYSCKNLTETLEKIECFNSHQGLQSLFVDNRLYTWQRRLPESNSITSRVSLTVSFLCKEYHPKTKQNGLLSLLRVLRDNIDPNDELHWQLNTILNQSNIDVWLETIAEESSHNSEQLLLQKIFSLLHAHNYVAARKFLESLTSAEALYYRAITLLGGQKPRHNYPRRIIEINQILQQTCHLNSTQAHYYYLWAWIQRDYTKRHYKYPAKAPDVASLLRDAKNKKINKQSMENLFTFVPEIKNWLNQQGVHVE